MQLIRSFEQEGAALVGYGVHVLMLCNQAPDGPLGHRLAGLGGILQVTDDPQVAIAQASAPVGGCDLLVIDCDQIGGLAAGRAVHDQLQAAGYRLPVVLISAECRVQHFPDDRAAATVLRAPVSMLSLRVGFEHALRGRLPPDGKMTVGHAA